MVTPELQTQIRKLRTKYKNGIVHILLAGHGGIVNGKYTTAPSKQAKVNNIMVYEGVENRKQLAAILGKAKSARIDTVVACDTNNDTPRKTRISLINDLIRHYANQGKLAILWEIHHNAANGKATGFEVFTTRSNNFSDVVATEWYKAMEKAWPKQGRSDNSDGDPDKEVDFDVIKGISSFGILMEFAFFDTPKEYTTKMSAEGMEKSANATVSAMQSVENIFRTI